MIYLVAAHDKNRLIGAQGKIPWHISEDFKFYKELTSNNTILMGKTTFEGIGKPLPNRKTIVLVDDFNYKYDHPDVEVIYSLEEVLNRYKNNEEILYVSGGARVYESFMPYADGMYISLVEGDYQGDTYFPYYNESDFIRESETPKENFIIIKYIKK